LAPSVDMDLTAKCYCLRPFVYFSVDFSLTSVVPLYFSLIIDQPEKVAQAAFNMKADFDRSSVVPRQTKSEMQWGYLAPSTHASITPSSADRKGAPMHKERHMTGRNSERDMLQRREMVSNATAEASVVSPSSPSGEFVPPSPPTLQRQHNAVWRGEQDIAQRQEMLAYV